MACNSSAPKMSLKLLINSKKNEVVFAEAEKDAIDFLFSLLTLRIGTVASFLPKETCLGDLNESMKNLDGAYLLPNQSKDSPLKLDTPDCAILPFLNPSSSFSNPSPAFWNPSSSRSDGHVQGLVTYIVTNDLSVTPMSMAATMALLKKHKIEEADDLKEKVVAIGLEEALQLLRCALRSKGALTKVFLEKQETKTKDESDDLGFACES